MSALEMLQALSLWAYAFLFVAAILETVPAVGILVPGQLILLAAGAAGALGYLDVWLVFGVSALGAILGDALGYWAGRKGGTRLVEKYGDRIGLTGPRLVATNFAIQSRPFLAIVGGRYNSVTRAFVPFVAGSVKFPAGMFMAYNVGGGILWSATFTVLGFIFGEAYAAVEHVVNRVGFALVLGAVGAYVAWRLSRTVGERVRQAAAASGGLVAGGITMGFLGPGAAFGWGAALLGALLGVGLALVRPRRP